LSRTNPLIQALSLIVAAVLLGLALLVGAVMAGALLAIGAVAAIVIATRIWWLQRKMRAAAAGTPGRSARQAIEGEYTVVDDGNPESHRPRAIPRDGVQSNSRDGEE